jgi:hypothetical protein
MTEMGSSLWRLTWAPELARPLAGSGYLPYWAWTLREFDRVQHVGLRIGEELIV